MLKTSAALAAAPMFFTKGAYAKDFTNNPVPIQNLMSRLNKVSDFVNR
jgi:hypothetical protein